ncbi:unnamed protein product [Clonostachys solani]|uniref:Uncharacterized protein n=1 Tax=Clonostachys solani TaxID=160281 RepID=A0A9N9ZK61_9HYPO|nr:unnamed protein product [Clonostachys solani]
MTLPCDLEIHRSTANAENNIRNEWLEQGTGETIGVIEHPGTEVPELAEQAIFWIEKNLWNKKWDDEWAHKVPEEEEGEQAAAQMGGQAEYLPNDTRPQCPDDGTPRIDRPAEGNNAHDGAFHNSFEAEEQLKTTIQYHAGPSRAPKEHTLDSKAQGAVFPNFNNQLQPPEESPSIRRLRLTTFDNNARQDERPSREDSRGFGPAPKKN